MSDAVSDGVGVSVRVAVGVRLGVEVRVGVSVRVIVAVGVRVKVGVSVGATVCVAVRLGVVDHHPAHDVARGGEEQPIWATRWRVGPVEDNLVDGVDRLADRAGVRPGARLAKAVEQRLIQTRERKRLGLTPP